MGTIVDIAPHRCYVGDTFVIIRSGRQANLKTHLNSVFTDLQFTMEEETNGVLQFLDVFERRGVTNQQQPSTDTQKKLRQNILQKCRDTWRHI